MILASALLLIPQGTPQRPVHYDRVEFIINDDIIRGQQILRGMEREARGRPLTTERERDILMNRTMNQAVEDLLRRQAGQDLGIDPKLIQLQVDGHSDQFIQNFGSVLGASEVLKEADLDSAEARELWEANLLRTIWVESVTGKGPNATGRIVSDRYVRPGEIYARYREYVEPPPWLPRLNPADIGGVDEQAVLSEVRLSARDVGAEYALQKSEEARAMALDGVDLNEIQALFGGPSPEPKPYGMFDLTNLIPPLAKWLETAKLDQFSPVMPFYSRDGAVEGYRFVHLVERVPAVIPPFTEAATQSEIRKQLLAQNDEKKIQLASNELFRRAYIWPPSWADPPANTGDTAQK